ncbi:hypothetical protein BO79DRAFT_159408, partial [Aspergillus costaricaensis CBS 115574]
WERRARREKVAKQTLRVNVKLYSASQVSYRQYLLFRTLLPPIVPPNQLNVQNLGISHYMAQANQWLISLSFNEYIACFSNRQAQTTGWVWGGTDRLFRVMAMQQQEVIRNLTINDINRGATESTVNTAFLSFLNAISDLGPQPAQRLWILAPKKLVADFSTPQRERRLVAYIDGQLEDVVLLKPQAQDAQAANAANQPNQYLPQAGRIIAWIKSFPAAAGAADSRVLLSKHGTELYISVSSYDDGWLRYMQGARGEGAGLSLQSWVREHAPFWPLGHMPAKRHEELYPDHYRTFMDLT